MDLTLTAQEERFRADAREWLEANAPAEPLPSLDTHEGFEAHREWEHTLHAGGWAVVSWPEQYGGKSASLVEWLLFEEEYYRVGAPRRVGQNGIFLLAPTIFEFGTDDQRERLLPRMARGDDIWSQAWSEPEAGSDLAAIRSTATRVEGGWKLNGQKTWSTRAVYADWAFGLFRSDPEAPRHAGLTYFLFPLSADGVSVRPIRQLDGEAGFAEIFCDDVFVPDRDVLGEPGSGWKVAMSTTGSERGLTLRSPGRFLASVDRLAALARQQGEALDATLRADVTQAWIDAEAYRLYTFGTVGRMLAGESVGAESSLNKLFWSELDIDITQTALRLLGQRAVLGSDAPDVAGQWLADFLFALAGPIYAGTNEIQRNVVAERVLRLPKGGVMRFGFTSDQRELAGAVREILAAELTADARASAADPGETSGRRGPVWKSLAEAGVFGLLVPESAGGLGLSELDAVLVLEELGRAAVPGLVAETAFVGAPLVAAEPGLAPWREGLAEGAVAVTVGAAAGYVPDADVADVLLVLDGSALSALAPAADLVRQPTVDPSRPLFSAPPIGAPVVNGPGVAALRDRAVLATAAQLVGAAHHLLTASVAYAKTRKQFGREIGSFQALKHQLADLMLAVEFARPLVHRAAYSLANAAPTASRDSSAAKVNAARAAEQAARTAIQVHGAIGYTDELDLQYWLKRVWWLVPAWGDAITHRALVSQAVIDVAPLAREQVARTP